LAYLAPEHSALWRWSLGTQLTVSEDEELECICGIQYKIKTVVLYFIQMRYVPDYYNFIFLWRVKTILFKGFLIY
jgi:hypothetical protein